MLQQSMLKHLVLHAYTKNKKQQALCPILFYLIQETNPH